MPPRYSYWTILAGGLPTAFRATEREELLPTFQRLREKHPDAELKWFAQGKLWSSPDEARSARDKRPHSGDGERRDRDWRPGGSHRDPRQKFVDAKKARNARWRQERFDRRQNSEGPPRGEERPRPQARTESPRPPREDRNRGPQEWRERPEARGNPARERDTPRRDERSRPPASNSAPRGRSEAPRPRNDRGDRPQDWRERAAKPRDNAPRERDTPRRDEGRRPPASGDGDWRKRRDGKTGAPHGQSGRPRDEHAGSRPRGDWRSREDRGNSQRDGRGPHTNERRSAPSGRDRMPQDGDRPRPPARENWRDRKRDEAGGHARGQGDWARGEQAKPKAGGYSPKPRGARDDRFKKPWDQRENRGSFGNKPKPRGDREQPSSSQSDWRQKQKDRPPQNRRPFDRSGFGRNQSPGAPPAPPRPRGPDREPRPSEDPGPGAPPRPSEPRIEPPGPPERGRHDRPRRR